MGDYSLIDRYVDVASTGLILWKCSSNLHRVFVNFSIFLQIII